jgi:hypothetical protein
MSLLRRLRYALSNMRSPCTIRALRQKHAGLHTLALLAEGPRKARGSWVFCCWSLIESRRLPASSFRLGLRRPRSSCRFGGGESPPLTITEVRL